MSHTRRYSLQTFALVLLGPTFMLLLAPSVLAEVTSADDWKFSASAYLWAPEITAKTSGDDVKITFNDIISDLDMAYMGSFGAKKGKLSFLTDVLYFDLAEKQDAVLVQDAALQLELSRIALKAWIVTPTAAYEVVRSKRWDVSILAGARYFWLEAEANLEEQLLGASRSYQEKSSNHAWDGIVGASGSYNLNDKWHFPFLFDVGTGDTDLTWQAYAAALYRTGNWEVGGGWRYMTWDFDEDDPFGVAFSKLSVNGPLFGVKYNFQ